MKQILPSDAPIIRQLNTLLEQASAPITDKKVAAIIQFEDGTTSEGFNTETSSSIIHAEDRALKHAEKGTLIKTIYLAANGSPMDVKHALPCEDCARQLAQRISPNAQAVLFFNDSSGRIALDLQAIHDSYKTHRKESVEENLDKTSLTDIDKKIVGFIARALKSHDGTARLYITGSAAGRGGPTSLLAKEVTGVPYWDVDLILIQQKSGESVHRWFQKAYADALEHVGAGRAVSHREEPSYVSKQGLSDSQGFVYHRLYWKQGTDIEIQPPEYSKDAAQPSAIDLTVGKSLAAIITPTYRQRRWYTRLEMVDTDPALPAHMRYTFVHELCKAKSNPSLLARYLEAIVNDDEAFESAVSSMVRIPVGFNTLYVSRNPRLQLNFYRDDITGNEDPHGHPAWARTSWYAPRGALQKVVFHHPLPKGTKRLSGLPVQELRAMSLTNIQTTKGGRPLYGIKPLKPTLVLRRSTVRKATLSSEEFPPWDPHVVTVNNLGGRVAISTHYKSQEEPTELSSFEGLVNYKGLDPDSAMEVLDFRAELSEKIRKGHMTGANRIGPSAMVYTPLDRKIEDMEPLPVSTPRKLAEELILGGLRTAQELARTI